MRQRIAICGGGTGGHFFCGLAFAEKYLEQNPQAEVLFIGVRSGIEGRYVFEDSRMKIRFVRASGFKNRGTLQKFDAILALFVGIFQALGVLWSYRARLIIGVGGYSSIPGVIAGVLLKPLGRHRVAIVEQNSSPGLANKVFSKFPIEAYAAFPLPGFETIELPMRRVVEERVLQAKEPVWPPRKILVMGGSQGAQGLNQAWMSLLPKLQEAFPQISIVHQTGNLGFDYVKSAYENLGISAEVFKFSERLGEYLSEADLVVSRAGALSLFEMMAYRRPAVLIPFPQAADDHQFKNAEAVQIAQWIIPQHQLNWERFREILFSERAFPLEWKKGRRTGWRKLLR